MKKVYEEANLKVILLACEDILTTSDWGEIETDENELPII